LASILGLSFLILFVLTFPDGWHALQGKKIQDPYYTTGPSIPRLLHETLPNFGIPFTLVFAMCLKFPAYFILLIFFILWRLALGKANLATLFEAISNAVPSTKHS